MESGFEFNSEGSCARASGERGRLDAPLYSSGRAPQEIIERSKCGRVWERRRVGRRGRRKREGQACKSKRRMRPKEIEFEGSMSLGCA